MKNRILSSLVIAGLLAAPVIAQAPAAPKAATPATPKAAAPAAKAWTPTKTPWGDPDLQGIYTSDDYIGVGLQRAEALGTRLFATEEEIAAAQSRISNNAVADSQEFANPDGN